MLKLKLHWQILIAMIFGIIFGIYYQNFGGNEGISYSIITSLGTIFIRLLKMIIVPLIFCSIVSGVSGIENNSKLGRIGIKTFSYYFVTSLLAILVGLTLTNLIQPGLGTSLNYDTNFDANSIQKPGSPAEILIRMIPINPIQAASSGDMLGIIFFAIFLGFGITQISDESSNLLKNLFKSIFEAMMKITQIIIQMAPIGVFGLITKSISISGITIFSVIGKYMITIAFGLSIHLFVTLPLLFYLTTKINPIKHFYSMSSAMATAFSTSSSNATLPMTIKCVKENAGVSNEVSSFVLPMGATINMDGTALYECAGVLFISQVLGIELTLLQQCIIVLTALLASIGAAGIPSAGLVMIFIVTQAVGFNDQDVAMIIGTMLAVDRPLDMMRTMVNIFSDSMGASIIANSEGEKLYNS
tara:strand:+ start:424 stop:1668 length:1245 start_codon:yes stop_codon:yes gene_type:complete